MCRHGVYGATITNSNSQMDMFRASCPSSEYTMTNHGGHPTKAEKIEIVNNNRITNYTSWRG